MDQHFEISLTATGVRDKKRQRALILHVTRAEGYHIFYALPNTGADIDYDTVHSQNFEKKINIQKTTWSIE